MLDTLPLLYQEEAEAIKQYKQLVLQEPGLMIKNKEEIGHAISIYRRNLFSSFFINLAKALLVYPDNREQPIRVSIVISKKIENKNIVFYPFEEGDIKTLYSINNITNISFSLSEILSPEEQVFYYIKNLNKLYGKNTDFIPQYQAKVYYQNDEILDFIYLADKIYLFINEFQEKDNEYNLSAEYIKNILSNIEPNKFIAIMREYAYPVILYSQFNEPINTYWMDLIKIGELLMDTRAIIDNLGIEPQYNFSEHLYDYIEKTAENLNDKQKKFIISIMKTWAGMSRKVRDENYYKNLDMSIKFINKYYEND